MLDGSTIVASRTHDRRPVPWFWRRDALSPEAQCIMQDCRLFFTGWGELPDPILGPVENQGVFQPTETGLAATVDGSQELVYQNVITELSVPFTFIFWMRLDPTLANVDFFIDTHDYADRQANYYGANMYYNASTSGVWVQYLDGGVPGSESRRSFRFDNTIITDAWHVYGITIDSPTTGRFYRDGVLIDNTPVTSGTGGGLATADYTPRLGPDGVLGTYPPVPADWGMAAVIDHGLNAREHSMVGRDPGMLLRPDMSAVLNNAFLNLSPSIEPDAGPDYGTIQSHLSNHIAGHLMAGVY